MRKCEFSKPPESLRRSSVHLDNVALVPASLLLKAECLDIANSLSPGETLIVLPYKTNLKQVARSVATQLLNKGRRVHLMESNLRTSRA